MIKVGEKTIDQRVYVCTQFPARRGLVLQARLLKLVGPIVLAAVGTGRNLQDALTAEVDFAAIFASVAHVQPDEFASLAFDLMAGTRRDGQEITPALFDLEFAGDYGHLFRVLAFVVEHNFGSIFGGDGIGGLTVSAPKAGRSPASSQPN